MSCLSIIVLRFLGKLIMIRWIGKRKPKLEPITYEYAGAVNAVLSHDMSSAAMLGLYRDWRYLSWNLKQIRWYAEDIYEHSDVLLCVASLSSNGYIREAAIQAMSGKRNAIQLPFILWALRDWVPQVREAAYQTFETCFVDSLAEAWFDQYTLLKHVAMAERVDLTPMLDRITAFLLTQPEALIKASTSPKALQRRFAYQLCLKIAPSDDDILEAASNDIEPANRAWLAQQLPALEPALATKWTRRLLDDPSPQVLQYVLREMPTEIAHAQRDRLVALLLSPNWNIRHAARFIMGDWDKDTLAAHYRTVLKEILAGQRKQSDLQGTLGGLGDTGNQSDFDLFTPHTASDSARVRAEAVRSMGALDRSKASAQLIRSIEDDNAYVRKMACLFLKQDCEAHELDQLFALLQTSTSDDCVRSILAVLGMRSWWTTASAAILTAGSTADSVSQCGWSYGVHHYHRNTSKGWLTPDANERVRLAHAMDCYAKSGRSPAEDAKHWQLLMDWAAKVVA